MKSQRDATPAVTGERAECRNDATPAALLEAMRPCILLGLMTTFALSLLCGCQRNSGAKSGLWRGDSNGFKAVFNGRDFSGWLGAVEGFEVREGAIACRPGAGGTIYTRDVFTNFIVRLEFKLPPGGNNGLAIRYPGWGDPAYDGMCECQVLDDRYERATGQKIDPRQAHGSAYGMVAAARGHQRPTGEWNFQEVTVKGSTVKVELNGTVILDADLREATDYMGNAAHPGKDRASGHFGFAGHNDPVMFRNIQIKPLD